MGIKMTPEQIQKILDNAPEWVKYVRKTSGMTRYSEAYFVGATTIEKLRAKLNKHNTPELESSDIPCSTIVLEK